MFFLISSDFIAYGNLYFENKGNENKLSSIFIIFWILIALSMFGKYSVGPHTDYPSKLVSVSCKPAVLYNRVPKNIYVKVIFVSLHLFKSLGLILESILLSLNL